MPVENNDLELSVGRALVSLLSPKEAPHYDEVIMAFQKRRTKSHDQLLGSGIPASELWAMSVSAYVLSKPILQFLWSQARKPTENLTSHAADLIEKRLSSWIDAIFAGPSPTPIRSEDFSRFSEELVRSASALGVSEENARRICAALHERLQLGSK